MHACGHVGHVGQATRVPHGPRWPGGPGGPEIQGGHMGPRWAGGPGGPEIQGGHQVQRLARPCSPGGATWDFAHGRQEAHVAILPAGARGRGGAKPTCATISGGKLPRTPCGRRRPTAREPRGILPPQPRENLSSHVESRGRLRGVLPRGNMRQRGDFILLQSQVASTWAREHGQGQSVALMGFYFLARAGLVLTIVSYR